ncbi:MAG: helix-turn-helix transcriptional regulator [Phycisphaerales bacterium]|nr:helix-turn-helix transcriptional regulator [Phycisphaerales bacterium]
MTVLRAHRLAKGLTARRLSKRIGVSPAAVSKWENGLAMPNASSLPKLAKALDLDPFRLIRLMTKLDPEQEVRTAS